MYANFEIELRTATNFMIEKHGLQNRKRDINGVFMPYFTHPFDVMQLVWKWGAGKPKNMLASLGHDIEEDCKLTEAEIIAGFTPQVPEARLYKHETYFPSHHILEAAKIITELSFLPPAGIDKETEKTLKDEYLRTFDKKSIDAFVIKLADRFCNSMDYKLSDPRYAFKYFKKAQFLFDTLSLRCDEIEAAFGQRTYDNICSTYQSCLIQLSEDTKFGIAVP